jgi:hypothetical protein
MAAATPPFIHHSGDANAVLFPGKRVPWALAVLVWVVAIVAPVAASVLWIALGPAWMHQPSIGPAEVLIALASGSLVVVPVRLGWTGKWHERQHQRVIEEITGGSALGSWGKWRRTICGGVRLRKHGDFCTPLPDDWIRGDLHRVVALAPLLLHLRWWAPICLLAALPIPYSILVVVAVLPAALLLLGGCLQDVAEVIWLWQMRFETTVPYVTAVGHRTYVVKM